MMLELDASPTPTPHPATRRDHYPLIKASPGPAEGTIARSAGPQNKEPRRVGRGSLTLCFSPRFLAGISSGVVYVYCPIRTTRV